MNPYIKFGDMSVCSQDVERKRYFGVNQGPQLWHKFGENDACCNGDGSFIRQKHNFYSDVLFSLIANTVTTAVVKQHN